MAGPGLSPMDIVAVVARVVQEQHKAMAELEARLAAMEPMDGAD